MPDIFDEVGETKATPSGDVFDEVSPEIPKPQPWELSPTGQKPYLGQFSGGPFSPYEELNREEAINLYKSLAEPPIAAPRFEGETTLGKVAAGVGNVAGGIYNMLASPVGLATLPLAGTKIGAPIAKGVFGGLAAKTAGEQLGEASVTGDVQQYTEGFLNALMAPGIALPGKFGYVEPEKVRMAKDLAREIGRAEPTIEPTTPEAQRQLGVRVPDVSPFAEPEVSRLADLALQERMRLVQVPGQEQNALMDLRRAIEPPRVDIAQPVARAERIQGGGQAPYGRVSFMREAEAPLPERTQAALEEPVPKPAEIVAEPAKPVEPAPVEPTTTQNEQQTVPELDIKQTEQRGIETYGERYIRELGPEAARKRIEHLNARTAEELAQRPIDQNAIRRLQQEAQNIANALDKPPPPPAIEAKAEPVETIPIQDVLNAFGHLVGKNETLSPAQFADRIKTQYDIANPKTRVAYDSVLAMDPNQIIKGNLQGISVRGRHKGNISQPIVEPVAPPASPAPALSEGKAKQPWEMTAEEAVNITGLTWDKWQDSISAATKEGKLTEESPPYKSAASTGYQSWRKLASEAQRQPPAQPSARAEAKQPLTELYLSWSKKEGGTIMGENQRTHADVVAWAKKQIENLKEEVREHRTTEKENREAYKTSPNRRVMGGLAPESIRAMGAKMKKQEAQYKIDFLKSRITEHERIIEATKPPTPTPTAQPVGEPQQTKGIITGRAIEKWADDTLRGGATHLGPDVLAAYLVKGAALIERGIINFAEWSARMIAEHGDKVKPHLRELFTAAQETVNRTPIAESGTLRSSREIVEQRMGQSQAQPSSTSTTVPAASPVPPTTPTATQPATTAPPVQPGARPRAQVTLDDIYRIFEPAPKQPTPLKTRGINLIESIRTGFSSKFRPINQLAEEIAKAYGGAKKDIAGIFEQLKGSSGKGEADIYRFNRDVSSLVKGQEKDFNAYMFLNRSLDRLRQDLADIQTAMAGGNVPRLNRRSVAQYTIPQLESKLAVLEQKLGPDRLATFQKAASEYQRYMDDALKLQVESGRMSQDVYDAIKSGNQFYAPFKVMKYLEEGMKPEGTGRKIDTVADYTKAMEGIEDPDFRLGDMLGAARQSLLTSRILADKAIAMRNIADLSRIDTQQLFIKRLNKGQDVPLGMQAVNVFEKGEKVRYATRPEVAEALEIYGNTGGGIISGILRGFSVPFKLGATALNVPFQISNLMADVPRQALVSKYGIRGVNDLVRYPLDLVHAIYSSMAGDILRRDNKLFLDFLDSGAAATTVQEHLTPKALQYRDPSTMSKSKRVALNILYSPAEFSTAIEQVSKILGVKRAMRFEGVTSGAELAKQVPEAITEIRRFSGSPDFGRQGKFVEQARLNLLYMFLNARIQGAVADLGRLTGRDGAKRAATTWFRVGSAIGLPTAYLYALNNSPEFKADYDKRPQQEKDNYWLIPKDSYITNEQGEKIRDYWRVPKRESSKWIANMTESALNFAEKKDAKTFANFSQKMIEDISPVNIQGNTAQERLESVAASLNPVIKAPLELATGRDMYRHRDLLGDTLRRASPEEQYTDRTATAFKVMAGKMPDIAPDVLRSPIMLENITRNLTAGLLTQFLSKKPVEGRGSIENAALLQRFQAVPYTDNAEFTKQMQALERESADDYLRRHRAAQKLIEDNKGKTLSELIGKSSQDPKVMKQVVDLWMAKENGATSQDRRLIALPAKQRAQYIAKMLKSMTPVEQQQAIIDLSKKRVLTETVFQEMSQLPQ